MPIYKKDGTKISNREMKRDIMKAHGWTAEQYRKQYDIFKNKLRAYESFQRAHGVEVKTQSPSVVLYKQAKSMLREGADYQPSIKMQRIQAFSAVSITKGRELAKNLTSVYTQRRTATFEDATTRAFANFINDVGKAHDIVYGVPLTTNSPKSKIDEVIGNQEFTIVGDTYFVDGVPQWEVKPVLDPVKREKALAELAGHIHAKQKPSGETFAGEQYGSDPAGDDFDYGQWLD